MARAPMVTRTIQTTVCVVLCLNVETAEPFNKQVTLPRTYKDENSMLKMAKSVLDTDNEKVVHIVNSYVEETRYGMSEQEFIEHAQIIPPIAEPKEQ